MIGVCRSLVILLVASVAICGCARELVADVAARARHRDVCPGKRELREGVVVKSRALPAYRVVAGLARCWETCCYVIGIRSSLVIVYMAAIAVSRRALEPPADMARGAHQLGMRSDQGEPRHLRMIEAGAKPGVHAVAGFAGRRKIQRGVV